MYTLRDMNFSATSLGKKNTTGGYLFRHLSFSIPHGQIWGLLGPSGCGKTTLLRTLCGIELIDEGQIFFSTSLCGFMFQDHQLFAHKTLFDNIYLPALYQKKPLEFDFVAKIKDLIAFFELTGKEDRYPHELSGGQKQRVAFMRSFILQPQLFLLDEPTSALDQEMSLKIKYLLDQACANSGMSCLIVSHDESVQKTWFHSTILMKEHPSAREPK